MKAVAGRGEQAEEGRQGRISAFQQERPGEAHSALPLFLGLCTLLAASLWGVLRDFFFFSNEGRTWKAHLNRD